MLRVEERPLRGGFVYPCTVQEIERRLGEFPPEDLEGLKRVALVPATRYDVNVYGRFIYDDPRPTIHLYAQPSGLTFRPGFGKRHLRCCLEDEIRFGIEAREHGKGLICAWTRETLRRWILEFILPHEVGHHVSHLRRMGKRLEICPGVRECERFADDYAREQYVSRGL